MFLERYGSGKISVDKSGNLRMNLSVNKSWSDAIRASVLASLSINGPVSVLDKREFSAFKDFLIDTELDTISNEEYWNLVNETIEKVEVLCENGLISMPYEDLGMLVSESFSSEVVDICFLKKDSVTVVDSVSRFRRENVIEVLSSVFKNILKDATLSCRCEDIFSASRLLLCNNNIYKARYYDVLMGAVKLINTEKYSNIEKYNTYLATDKTGYVKIGRSSDIQKRLHTLKIGNPTIKMLCSFSVDVGNKLHKRFYGRKVNGEWFNLSKEEIVSLTKEFKINWKNPMFDKIISNM